MKWMREHALYSAWVIAFFGGLFSLFVGELLRIEPCNLCWYQRIALFPLVIQLGIATYRNDLKILPYVYPLVGAGALVALYQVIGQYLPFIFSSATCGYNEECSNPIFTLFGFLTFPILSLLGFLLIGYFLILAKKRRH